MTKDNPEDLSVPYDLSPVHGANLKILKEIDRICRKYEIPYMIDSGTLLGAVRHQGFIPWDDDADVAFTRDNYERFAKVVRKELPKGLKLLEPHQLGGGRAFYDFTPRILYMNSRTHQDGPEMDYYGGRLNHLWVDLFIIDELPENPVSAAFTKFLHKAIYGLAMGHRYKLDFAKYSLANKIMAGGLSALGKLVPMKWIRRMQFCAAVKDKKGTSSLNYYSNYQPDYLYVTLRKEWCQETVDMEFEGEMLMVPAGWHQVLTCVYGDYMTPPPPDKQIPAHSDMEIEVFE